MRGVAHPYGFAAFTVDPRSGSSVFETFSLQRRRSDG
jgi:hypothetical protein